MRGFYDHAAIEEHWPATTIFFFRNSIFIAPKYQATRDKILPLMMIYETDIKKQIQIISRRMLSSNIFNICMLRMNTHVFKFNRFYTSKIHFAMLNSNQSYS